ncbi:MAG: UbiD family decarboxylase [Phycisphaerales bacterium]
MPSSHKSLRDFLTTLDAAGELRRIRAKVDPVLEISAIADKVSKQKAPNLPSKSAQRTDPRFHHLGGPALLFENVQGSDIPVLINAYGSYRRMEIALGVNEAGPGVAAGKLPGGFEALAHKIAELTKPEPPRSLRDLLAKAKLFAPLLKIPPNRMRGSGPCHEVVLKGDQVDLTKLPIIKCWPLDGDFASLGYPPNINDNIEGLGSGEDWNKNFRGRYITLAGIHTIHADDINVEKPSSHNIGMYRVQLLGKQRLAMHWHMHHDGARHWKSWKKLGKPMPVAIALGGEAILPYAATAPLPPGLSELLLAGFLNGSGIEMARAKTVPLWVPANAEIIIEGYVSEVAGDVGFLGGTAFQAVNGGAADKPNISPHSLGPGAVFEGPFGDHTGFYSLPDRYPILTVTAITMRRNPIYPTTVVGLPPQEDYFLGKATERIFLPLLRTIMPDIEDYDLPMFGAFHNCAFVQIKKSYPLHARRVMHGIWGAGQMSWTKTIFVVDHDVDVHDAAAVLRAAGEHCVPARDCELVRGPLDILDHAAPFLGAGGKLGLDTTRKTSEAETHRVLSDAAETACKSGEIGPVLGDAARTSESLIRKIPNVLDARIPDQLGGWWLLVQIQKQNAKDGANVIKALGDIPNHTQLPRYIIVVDRSADISNFDDVLFHWLAHSSHDRDQTLSICGRRIAYDATPKLPGDERNSQPVRNWPPLLRISDEIRTRIESRWREYGL